jgi:hypothetical protein
MYLIYMLREIIKFILHFEVTIYIVLFIEEDLQIMGVTWWREQL